MKRLRFCMNQASAHIVQGRHEIGSGFINTIMSIGFICTQCEGVTNVLRDVDMSNNGGDTAQSSIEIHTLCNGKRHIDTMLTVCQL